MAGLAAEHTQLLGQQHEINLDHFVPPAKLAQTAWPAVT
jgi:hypothetical protein